MKKIFIFLLSIVVLIMLSPIIGNRLIEQELNNKIEVLVSYGIAVTNSKKDKSYFNTNNHYELRVIDSDKFLTYLQNFTSSHLPTYMSTFIDGTTMGVDITYSNFPLSDALALDIYPMSLSEKNMDMIAKKDSHFAVYVEKLLKNKTIFYHINYNIIKSEFNGFIKDINESYTIQNGRKIAFKIKGFTFAGNGLLVAPDRINSKTKELSLVISEADENIGVIFKDLSSTSNFESTSTYLYGGKIKSFEFTLNNSNGENKALKLEKLHLNVASNTQAEKAEFSTKISFDTFEFKNKKRNTQLNGFNYDLYIKDIDKKSFENLSVLLAQTSSLQSEKKKRALTNAMMEMLANGLEMTLADFSVKKIDYVQEKGMDGLSVKSDLVIKKDEKLLKNLTSGVANSIDKIVFHASIKISKKLFLTLKKEFALLTFVESYAKEAGEILVYNIEIKDNKLIVNGKKLR